MPHDFQTTRVLITVMTYPHPSRGYSELVCTAGITEAGEWVRLYPVDYRHRLPSQRFHKYQWIQVGLASGGKGNDRRRESRRPDLDSIQIDGEPLSTKNGWHERRLVVDRMPVYTRKQLEALYASDMVSLGLVQPTELLELRVEKADRDWKPEWQRLFDQFHLFGGAPKDLSKIPYKFSYVFRCQDSDSPHTAMIEDWELGVLFLKERERLATEKRAIESVRENFHHKMFAADRDTKLFMGTVFPYNSWVVIGVYYPPKFEAVVTAPVAQLPLF